MSSLSQIPPCPRYFCSAKSLLLHKANIYFTTPATEQGWGWIHLWLVCSSNITFLVLNCHPTVSITSFLSPFNPWLIWKIIFITVYQKTCKLCQQGTQAPEFMGGWWNYHKRDGRGSSNVSINGLYIWWLKFHCLAIEGISFEVNR